MKVLLVQVRRIIYSNWTPSLAPYSAIEKIVIVIAVNETLFLAASHLNSGRRF